jgi:hypothetical protein
MGEPRVPGQRNADRAAIHEFDHEGIIGDHDILRTRLDCVTL